MTRGLEPFASVRNNASGKSRSYRCLAFSSSSSATTATEESLSSLSSCSNDSLPEDDFPCSCTTDSSTDSSACSILIGCVLDQGESFEQDQSRRRRSCGCTSACSSNHSTSHIPISPTSFASSSLHPQQLTAQLHAETDDCSDGAFAYYSSSDDCHAKWIDFSEEDSSFCPATEDDSSQQRQCDDEGNAAWYETLTKGKKHSAALPQSMARSGRCG
jgi:hypothetical protein